MKQYALILLAGGLFTLTSCSDKTIAPKFTHVEKMLNAKPGMAYDQVKAILGSEPYDIYVDQESGKAMYTWMYKHDQRYVSAKILDKPEGATMGDPRVMDQSTVYCVFSNDYKLESISTADGRKDAVRLMLFDNTFRVASSDVEKYNSFELSKNKIQITDLGPAEKKGLGGLFGKKK